MITGALQAGMVRVETFSGDAAAVKAALLAWFQDDAHAQYMVVGESAVDLSGTLVVLLYYTTG